MTTQAKPEQSDLPDNIEQLIEQRIDSLVAERLDALVKERVAQAMKRDPAKRKVAINIPIGYGQFGVMAAWLFPPETVLLLITADDEDLGDAIDSLMVVGMTNPLSALTGDQGEWKDAGLTIAETPLVKVEDLAHRITAGKVGTLVDVREKGEMEQGTIAGAINLPYREMRTRETLPSLVEPVAAFCNSGNRSSVAASLLERLGLSVMNVAGGTTAWMEAGLPLTQPDA